MAAALLLPGGAPAAGASKKTSSKSAPATSAPAKAQPASGSRITYLALTFDGRKLALYVNGRETTAHSESGPPDAGQGITEIGGYAGRSFWNGAIDDVAIYDTSLSPQAIGAHYHLGTSDGSRYARTIQGTHGIVSYWKLDNAKSVRPSVGRAQASVVGHGAERWISLIAHSSDPALALNGFDTEVRVRNLPTLRRYFTVEAWVLPGPKTGNRAIVGRPGAWFLKTDVLGHWSGGFFHNRRISGVVSSLAARIPLGTAGSHPVDAPAASKSSGTSPLLSAIILMVIAGFAAAAIPTYIRRRRRQRASSQAKP